MTREESGASGRFETGALADFVPLARLDREGRLDATTAAYDQINGGPADESNPLGLQLLHPDDIEAVRALVEKVVRTPGTIRRIRCRVGDESTGTRTLSVTLSNRIHEPAIRGMLVELQEAPAGDAAIRLMLDALGQIRSADPSTRLFLGETLPATNQARLLEIVHPDDRTTLREAWSPLLSDSGSTVSLEFRLRRWDGEWRWIQADFENRLGTAGVGAIAAKGRDVTARRVEQRQWFDRNTWLDALLQGTPWKLMVFNLEGRLSYASAGIPGLLGMRDGFDPSACQVEPDFGRELIEVLERVSGEPGNMATSEFRHPDPEHDPRWLRVYWVNRCDDPLIRGVLSVVEDVTERRELESRYLQAQKAEMIGQLTGGLTHDFNNVLGVIIAGLDLIEGNSDLAPNTLDELSIVRTAANRAARLARQLLGVSRPRATRPEELDIAEVSLSMKEMLQPMLGESIALDVAAGVGRHIVRIERGHLEQVILNLCVNARDAMPEGGRISIRVGRERKGDSPRPSGGAEPFITLEVRDSGVGMSATILRRAMEPYFTTKDDGERGSGLGLFMVERIVSQAGGRVEMASEPGEGTRIRLLLPAVGVPALEHPALPEKVYDGVTLPGMVLVVEDERDLQQMQLRMLERAGYDVLSADSVAAAMNVATSHAGQIDLLMTDLVLPDGHGARLAQDLLRGRPAMKVLFSTGYAPRDAGLDAVQAGIPLLNKPYTENELLDRVREVLAGVA